MNKIECLSAIYGKMREIISLADESKVREKDINLAAEIDISFNRELSYIRKLFGASDTTTTTTTAKTTKTTAKTTTTTTATTTTTTTKTTPVTTNETTPATATTPATTNETTPETTTATTPATATTPETTTTPATTASDGFINHPSLDGVSVNKDGQVRVYGKEVKNTVVGGYLKFYHAGLKRQIMVGRTMLETFEKSSSDTKKKIVCYKDNNKNNCHIDNLYWGSLPGKRKKMDTEYVVNEICQLMIKSIDNGEVPGTSNFTNNVIHEYGKIHSESISLRIIENILNEDYKDISSKYFIINKINGNVKVIDNTLTRTILGKRDIFLEYKEKWEQSTDWYPNEHEKAILITEVIKKEGELPSKNITDKIFNSTGIFIPAEEISRIRLKKKSKLV